MNTWFSVLVLASMSFAQAGSAPPDKEETKLQLSVKVLTRTVSAGQTVKVRVEIKNSSDKEIAISRWLVCVTNGPTCLSYEFEDERGNKFGGAVLHATGLVAGEDWWTGLAPGHYYGLEDRLEGIGDHPLLKPGRYKIVAKYRSKQEWRDQNNCPRGSCEGWTGEIVSNKDTFEITNEP